MGLTVFSRNIIFSCILILGIFIFVSAASFNADFNPKSVNEDINNLYNFSINNTDPIRNITHVNITLPTNFTFNPGTNRTSVTEFNFSNTSTVLKWNATYLIQNGTTEYFWFNATAITPGTYNFTIYTLDNDSITNSTNITVTVNDTTFPLISYESATEANNSNVSQNWIYVNVSVTEDFEDTIIFSLFDSSGEVNTTIYTSAIRFINFTGLPDETYSYNVTVNDTAGNSNSTKIRTIKTEFDFASFDDLDLCEEGIIGDLELEIDNPDSGDDFEVGDTIKIRVEVTNNADEDKDIIVEASLYNIDEDDEIENIKSNDEEINEDDSETFKLEIEVPDDFDHKDDYLIFVKAYEDNDEEEQCDQGVVEINLDREKHKVIIKNIFVNPRIVYSGNKINVFVDVQNIGSNDEDVYVTLENSVLGISEKSETFELEEFDEDDFFTQIFFVKIPNNAEEGEYSLNIKVVFDGESDERTETISVLKTLFLTSEFDKSVINIDFKDEKPGTIKIGKKDYSKTIAELPKTEYSIVFILAIGIIILVLLIITVPILRRRFG